MVWTVCGEIVRSLVLPDGPNPLALDEVPMREPMRGVRCVTSAVVIVGALVLSACSTTGRIGQMFKFDIANASTEDIA